MQGHCSISIPAFFKYKYFEFFLLLFNKHFISFFQLQYHLRLLSLSATISGVFHKLILDEMEKMI